MRTDFGATWEETRFGGLRYFRPSGKRTGFISFAPEVTGVRRSRVAVRTVVMEGSELDDGIVVVMIETDGRIYDA